MNKKLIRKMQTAAGGPIRRTRILFTPEQIALFESQAIRIPGMNNSGGDRYREEGVLALQYLEQEKKRKELEIRSRMEMRPTLKRKATIAEKLQGKKDEYEQIPLVIGMSGTDPVGEFILAGIGLNGIGALAKTGLWNVAKYAPTTQLGNWGRGYFVRNAFKNSFNGTVPTLTSQATSLLYQPVKLNETGLTSLKFFERPSKISEAENLGFGRSRGFNPESGSDLHEFYTLLDRRQTIQDALRKLKAPEDMGVDETISKNSGSIIEDGYLMSNGYRYTPVTEKHFSTGTNMSFGRQGMGGSGHNYGLNLGGESTRVKDLGKESKITYSTPKTNLNRDDHTNLDVVITAENDKANKEGIKLLTKGMRDMESGAEFSGDASSTTAAEALSSWLRLAKNKPQLRETAMSNAKIALDNNAGISLGKHTITDPIHGIVTENATMSPDAYSYLYRTAANNPDKFHLGYTMKAGNFNSFARNPKNAYMYDVEQNYLDGLITPQEYVKQFNSWSLPLSGRKAYFYNGRVYKPQPFLIRNKQGGKMNTLEFLKNGNKIKKALLGTNLNVDTRSDTTRQGYNERGMSSVQSHNYFPLLDFYNAVEEISLTSNNPYLNTGVVYAPSRADRTWKFLHDFVKKNPRVLSNPTVVSKGMIPGNEITVGQVKQPLTGLTIRNNTPLTLENTVMNPAEKAAAEDYLASRNLKNFEEFPDVAINTKLPTGRPTGDYKYPKEIMEKYGFGKPKVTLQQLTTKPVSKTSSQRSKEYYSKKKEDKDNGVSRKRSRLVLNNKALTTGDMRAANTGRPRKAARNVDLETELKKDNGYWGREFNKIKLKVVLGKQGSELKYKDFLDSYWNYKLKGILGKEKFGGILNFYKNGSGIHIKEKNKGKFTSYCGGKVTDECILKGKNSSNPAIRKRATFAANARKWKHLNGGIIKAADGASTSSFWLKAGNFLNSDTGKGILDLGSLVFNGIKTGKDIANFSNSFDAATDSKIKAMESKMKADSYKQGLLKAKQYILLKQLENPDVHYGEIDLTNMAKNFANEFYDDSAIEDYKTQRANEKLYTMLAIQGSANTGFSDILQKGLGMVGNYFGNKSSSTTTSNITPNITLNLLNTSTIGKSTNPYMYTGLGANYNASTFFK